MKEKKQKDPGKKKTARIVVGSIFGVFALFVLTVVMITVIGNKALIKRAKSYDPAVIENQLVPEKDENGYWTFTTDRDLKVMQLTDIHIGGGWLSLKQDAQALNAVATMIQAEKPDLVVVTGDMAFPVFFKAGTFNNLLSAREFAALMERLGVYWTVAFGNHDSEIYSYYSREKVADFYGSPEFKYCLFQKGPDDVDGYGNQIINVKNSKGLLTQSIYIFDSHSYTDGDYFGIMWKYDNIHDNQIEWYRNNVNLMNKQNNARLKELGMPEDSDVKSIAFLHIPLPEQRTAWYEYMANGFKDTEDVKYVYGKAGEGKKNSLLRSAPGQSVQDHAGARLNRWHLLRSRPRQQLLHLLQGHSHDLQLQRRLPRLLGNQQARLTARLHDNNPFPRRHLRLQGRELLSG